MEISEVLEIPEKTVKSRLYSARQMLKDALTGNGA
jgi:DNA-directed RNA polymerase specialized sigma24 family protein